ncbi:MAG: YitT family protein [Clostridia bacterium]|nr:MAG: YitT family protein [Clostridia bacterium]
MAKDRIWQVVIDYAVITLGTVIVGTGLGFFLVPHKIAAGGISGLATVIYYLTGIPVGVTMFTLNVPLFIMAVRNLGVRFGVRTLYGTAILSLWIDFLVGRVSAPTQEPLLAAIYGGLLTGVGLGLVFRAGGTTGGTDLAALLLRRRLRASTGQALLVADGLVIATAAAVFGVELGLYALISLLVSSRMIDSVQEGVGYAKVVLIISSQPQEIANSILFNLNRGATALEGEGLYTSQKRRVILCVVNRAEISRLKALVRNIDPQAFMIVTSVHEALGEGFKDLTREII